MLDHRVGRPPRSAGPGRRTTPAGGASTTPAPEKATDPLSKRGDDDASSPATPAALGASIDSQVYEDLFRAHFGAVLKLCQRLLEDSADAEDVAQETFLRALHHREISGYALPWLLLTARHLCVDELRRRRRRGAALDVLGCSIETELSDVDRNTIIDGQVLRVAMGSLTELERRVFSLIILHDRSHTDASMTLHLSTSTSRVLLTRALKKIRHAR